MCRSGLILLAVLLGAGKLYALSVDTENRPPLEKPANGEAQTGSRQLKENSQQNAPPAVTESAVIRAPQPGSYPSTNNSEKQAAPPVSTFTPTEKISADSAVSFPVDI